MKRYEPITVSMYSGSKADETPRRFQFHGTDYEVADIEANWIEGTQAADAPLQHYFKVRAQDNKTYVLRYDQALDRWTIRLP